ncbi:MAG: PP2C family protein-serine/threonine phosphatase [Ignavibacteriae bacterium]|nr:PP2C family protein-serine/threonine phosphatase [Ignavibacteriota bacterium]
MDKLKVVLPSLVLIVAGVYAAYQLYPSVHPLGGIKLSVTPKETKAKAESIGAELSATFEGYWDDPKLSRSSTLLRQLQHEVGLQRANELTRNALPVYYWDVRWRKQQPSFFTTTQNEDGEEVQAGNNQVNNSDVRFRFDTRGNLIGYRRAISDTTQYPNPNKEEALGIARAFLERYTMFREQASADTTSSGLMVISFAEEQFTLRGKRVDFEFTWATKYPEMPNDVKLKVALAGNVISRLTIDHNSPKEYENEERQAIYVIAVFLFYVACIVTMIVLTFRRWRSGELGFRTAWVLGIFGAVLVGIEMYGTLSLEMGWTIIFPLLLGPLFLGGGLLFAWAVSESMGREMWKSKFVSFDLLLNGYVLHSRVGTSLLQGIAAGVLILLVWLGIIRGADATTTVALSIETGYLNSLFPALEVLSTAFYGNFYQLALFVLFMLAFLSRRMRSTALVLVIAALLYGLAHTEKYHPFWAGIVIASVIGFLFVYAFHRYDTLTSLFSLITFSALGTGLSFFNVGNASYLFSGYTVLGFFAVLVVGSGIALATKDPVVDFQELAPSFARYITERQRLQQELEVARKVQMTFLPKKEPDFPGLSIASRCAPALEVGGDYYDFIHLDGHKLGIAIGDVSGKGTQAAFYMTLTKGFLRALARSSDSPAKVLTEANKLFYDNVERGAFISMVYGIFDSKQRVLKLARAGHNPVIMRKPRKGEPLADKVEVIHPTGLALGLEPGEAFARTIQEVQIPYQPGDLFVFYTDGFPEAMNKKQEEFGEDRLCEVVMQYSSLSAGEVMDSVFKEMKAFVGKAKQHDDMTIVVVKTT